MRQGANDETFVHCEPCCFLGTSFRVAVSQVAVRDPRMHPDAVLATASIRMQTRAFDLSQAVFV
jgi:hypothetical protein